MLITLYYKKKLFTSGKRRKIKMKKFLAGLMAISLLAWNALPVLASESVKIMDVSKDYWARQEIVEVVSDNIMTLDESGNFYPEDSVQRVEFVKALLKLLSNDNLNVNIQNIFTDVSTSNPDYADILRSQQLGLVYGYPDKTFKPEKVMSRAETQSVISHITKDGSADVSVLNNFTDANLVPQWAKRPYAKSLAYGIYVNYPNADELRPNDDLTRAEAAVLLARLKDKIGLVKEEYVGPDLEKVLAIEHLNMKKNAPNHSVKITNKRNIVLSGNVLAVAFSDKFKSEIASAGDNVKFIAPQDICTDEGTVLFPANSVFSGKVLEVVPQKWFNKNARVYIQLTEVCTPDGKKIDLNAKPFYRDYALKEGPWMTAGKIALWTVGLGAVGTGAGVGFAFIPNPAEIGTGIAIGAPVGAGVGLILGLVTPGLKYHAKAGEQIYVILCDDASIVK